MGIRFLKTSAKLQGHLCAEEAEVLLQWLREHPKASVNLSECVDVHAAVLQVLLALRPKLTGTVQNPWLCAVLGTDRAAAKLSQPSA